MISKVEKEWVRKQTEKLKFCFLIILSHEVFPCHLIIIIKNEVGENELN